MRDLSLHLMDIVQNSVTAGASEIGIFYKFIKQNNTLKIIVTDNGKGMSEEQLAAVKDPFFTTRTTRDVGLGVPLFRMSAEKTGGCFSINSELGEGTSLEAFYYTDNIDMLPLGDTVSTVQLLITGNPEIDFLFSYTTETSEFSLDTRELREILEDVPLSSPSISVWIKEHITDGIKSVGV